MARTQAYPSRPVRIIVDFAAGGDSDITAHLIGQWLSERLGQPFIIQNRLEPEAISAPRATAGASGQTDGRD